MSVNAPWVMDSIEPTSPQQPLIHLRLQSRGNQKRKLISQENDLVLAGLTVLVCLKFVGTEDELSKYVTGDILINL